MELYTYYRSTASYRVRIALALKGLDFTALPVNLLVPAGGANRQPGYLAINPQGRVPALRSDEGALLIQSQAIIEYLEERYPQAPLLAKDWVARAHERAVASIIACDIHPLHNSSTQNLLRKWGHDEAQLLEWIGHWISQGLGAVEQLIGDTGFCFGEQPGLADAFLIPQLYAAERFKVPLAAYPRIGRVAALAAQHPASCRHTPPINLTPPEPPVMIVPTLSVGTPHVALCVTALKTDAERPELYSHAERGNNHKKNRYLAMHNQIASFRAALDARPVSRYQWLILLLLALLLVTDGYDAQVLGYVVPALAQDWGLEKSAFGPVFSANLLGLTLGSLLVTPLADRFGVRRILLACVLIYASLTVLMVFANSLTTLMAARFICGIGMGGAMPSAMALMSEYSPPRLRTLMVTLAACGFSFGGAAGGFVAAGFIDSFGWQAVFLAGGVTPLLLFPFLVWLLPESLPRLLRDAPPYPALTQGHGADAARLAATVRQRSREPPGAGQQADRGGAVSQRLRAPDAADLGDFFCQPDPAVFHDQLAAFAIARKRPSVE